MSDLCLCFFFKQKTAYEMRISDWSSDVCSSDLIPRRNTGPRPTRWEIRGIRCLPMPRYKRPRYIHVYRDKHGKQRIYYNRPGSKKIPLPGPINSEAFMVAYQKAVEGEAQQTAQIGRAPCRERECQSV